MQTTEGATFLRICRKIFSQDLCNLAGEPVNPKDTKPS